MPGLTPFQTAGPFLHIGLRVGLERAPADDAGHGVSIEGRLLDGAGTGIGDGVLEFWQAELELFHRVLTGADGGYRIETRRTPFLSILVMGRGILTCYLTRAYLDEVGNPDADPVLSRVPPERRATLVAERLDGNRYRFDVRLQGERETVFFDV